MDATIGDQTNNLWLFTGTGDYKRINARDNSENLLLGVKDRYFPNFQKVQTTNRSDLLSVLMQLTLITIIIVDINLRMKVGI